MRNNGRKPEELREVSIVTDVNPYAEGSAEVQFGNTKVLVTASLEAGVPKWKGEGSGGWITAEYGMLPRSTHTRSDREAARGKQSGRTLEIQRLIGRALRQAVPLMDIGEHTIRLDCDVLSADGGTRTAAICGGWVAMHRAIDFALKNNILPTRPTINQVVAISVGIVNGEALVDLEYSEDSNAQFDCNLVFDDLGQIIEVQGSAEQRPISFDQLNQLIKMGHAACKQLCQIQLEALGG